LLQNLACLAAKANGVALDIEHLQFFKAFYPRDGTAEVIELVETHVQAEEIGKVFADRYQV
jgi:hypothetical protein